MGVSLVSPTWLEEYVNYIDSGLSKLYLGRTQSSEPTSLQRAAAEALATGGKRVRAVLALLWCKAFSGDYKRALPVAVAYELAHATALIQDDIIDHSIMRRGKKSTTAKYGLSFAVLASDLLLFSVPKMVAMYRDLSSERLCWLFDLVGESCRSTTWGEFLDLEMAAASDVSEKEYDEMIRLKTASLLGAPAASGALVGGASREEVETAYSFGERLGMAYQIQDDLLDLMGDEVSLGKPVFTDLRGGKKNIVLIHALKYSSEEERSFLVSLFGREGVYSETEIQRARRVFSGCGSVEYAQTKVTRNVDEGKKILNTVISTNRHDSLALQHLLELSEYLSKRYY